MKLIVGLGNPGGEYRNTRHNAGFMVLERLANRYGVAGSKNKFHAGVLEAAIKNEKVMLMQPMTFMNRSGLSVGEASRFYKLEPQEIIVVVDDTALPLGSIRIRSGGSNGGHNGLADIQRALGSLQYPRLRVGVGEPKIGEYKIPQKDYVLGRFTEDELAQMVKVCDNACDALETWIELGIDLAMTRYNAKPNAKDNQEKNAKTKKTENVKNKNVSETTEKTEKNVSKETQNNKNRSEST